LLDLAGIGLDPTLFGGNQAAQFDIAAQQLAEQFVQVAHQIIEIDQLWFRRLFAGETEEVISQRRRTRSNSANLFEVFPDDMLCW
jgi:hypothetical protein